MGVVRTAILGAILSFATAAALAQSIAIPETLEVFEIMDPDALDRMRACNPRVKQENLDLMAQRLARKDMVTLTTILGADDRAAVVEKGGLWMCIQMSPQRYPVFPVDTIAAAMTAGGADPVRLKDFHRSIAISLAETGFARALITFPATGNASVVFFAVSAESPATLAVDSRFLKKGEFDAAEYSLRLDDPNVRAFGVAKSGASTQRDILAGKFPTFRIVDGYLIRKGNDRTRAFNFAGTTWKSPTALLTTYTLQKEGVVLFKTKGTTSFGSWKVDDGVLYFEINRYSYFSAVLDEQGYLTAEARNGGRSGMNRFRQTLFQEGNTAAEKEALEKLDGAFKALQMLISAKKAEILAESPEDQQKRDPSTRKRQSLCDMELAPAIMAIADNKGLKAGDLCHSYIGTRADWKDTILKDGCQGRCLPF